MAHIVLNDREHHRRDRHTGSDGHLQNLTLKLVPSDTTWTTEILEGPKIKNKNAGLKQNKF